MKKNIFVKILETLLHLLALGAIFYLISPVFKFFWESSKPLGNDFYQALSLAAYFRRHPALPPMSWAHIWFFGFPFYYLYGLFHYVLLALFWSLATPTVLLKIYLLAFFFLYLAAAYFVFFYLSRNFIFSIALTFAIAWSSNLYPAFFLGGNTNFVATMFALPLTFLFFLLYRKKRDRRWLALAGGTVGVTIFGHSPLVLFFVLAPFSLLFLLERKIKDGFYFGLLATILGGASLYSIVLMGTFWRGEVGSSLPAAYAPVFSEMISTSGWPLLGLAIPLALLAFVIRGAYRKGIFWINVFFLSFFALVGLTYYLGVNPFSESITPARIYWPFTFFTAALAAYCAGILLSPPIDSVERGFVDISKRILKEGGRLLGFVILSLPLLLMTKPIFEETIFSKAIGNAAYPFQVNLIMEGEESRDVLVAPFLEKDSLLKRLYSLDANFNMWWSTLFDLPIALGYMGRSPADAPDMRAFMDHVVWLGTIVPGGLAGTPHYTEEEETNTISFLLDWFGINYFEGTTKSEGGREYAYSLPERLWKDKSVIKQEARVSGLHYGEVERGDYPLIASATNVPTLAFVGSDASYDSFFRMMAAVNKNSQEVIPIPVGENVSDLKEKDLAAYDAILFYGYQDGSSNVWSLLEDYVESGGNLFIETGGREAESPLPEVFPIYAAEKGPLGETWDVEFSSFMTGVEFSSDAALRFNEDLWGFSYAGEEAIRSWAEVVMRQAGRPVVVSGSFGEGKVVWSGTNLFYHARSYASLEEAKLIDRLLDEILLSSGRGGIVASVSRDEPGRAAVTGSGFNGVLFKETAGDGWVAKARSASGSKKLKIYPAGMDFMYVRNPFPDENVTIDFFFLGSFKAWLFFLSFVVVLLHILDVVILRSRLTSNFFGIFKKVGGWWEREEEI